MALNSRLGDVLKRAFPNRDPIRYIQIGGNDGIHADPLYQYHVDRTFDFQWGQIFEPIPEYFHLLRANMRPFPYVKCHNLAVDDATAPGQREFSYVSHADIEKFGLPGSSKGIGSFSRDRNALGGIGYDKGKFSKIEGHIRTIQVQTVPAVDVISQYSDANFLLTDCEGYDVEIIRSAFSSGNFRPRVVQYEDYQISKDLSQSTLEDLQAMGYKVVRSGNDVICELT
jgi:FkbM family methyltransferase